MPRKQRSQPTARGRGPLGQGRDDLVQFGLVRQGLLEREEGGVEGALQGGSSNCCARSQVQCRCVQFLPAR